MSLVEQEGSWSTRKYISSGYLILFFLFGFGGWWSLTSEISGAVELSGFTRVESRSKAIEHPSHERVARILVSEGQNVSKGELLLVLESTEEVVGKSLIRATLSRLEVEKARLLAERNDERELVFGEDLQKKAEGNPDFFRKLNDEKRRFTASLAKHGQQVLRFEQQKIRVERQIDALNARMVGLQIQEKSIKKELDSSKDLFLKGLLTIDKVREPERELARMSAEIRAYRFEISSLNREILEASAQIEELIQARREVATEMLSENIANSEQFESQLEVANKALKNVEIRAPQAGVVQGLSVFSIGSIVRPGKVILNIVPVSDEIVVECQLPTDQRDRVYLGQSARVRFPAFNMTTTPEIVAEVTLVSSDMVRDPNANGAWYNLELKIAKDELKRLSGVELSAGMPAMAYLLTDERTPLSYLMKPLVDNFRRAFLEE